RPPHHRERPSPDRAVAARAGPLGPSGYSGPVSVRPGERTPMNVHGEERTVVSEPRWLTPALFVGLPVLGAALGWCLSLLADWYTGLPVAPFQGVVELLSNLAGRFEGVVDAGIGAVAGLLLAVAVVGRLL